MYLFRWRKGVCTNACIYMGTHIVSLYYRTAWWMFMKLGRDKAPLPADVFRLLSDLPWGGSKAGQEGVNESFKDERLYLECFHSGSGFGQIFQGLDPGRGKNVEEGLPLRWKPPSDQIFTATYTDVLPTTLSTHAFIWILSFWLSFFSDWTVCCWLSGER